VQVALEVSSNGGADFTRDGVEFLYEAGATVEGLMPSWGVSGRAGQVVTVSGRHFAQSSELSCRFGLDGSLRGQYVSSTLVECKVPERGAGTVTVTVSNNGADMSPTLVWYSYSAASVAFSMAPSSGPVSGGTRVMLSGPSLGAVAMIVTCNFGDVASAGTLKEGKVVCIAPRVMSSAAVTVRLARGDPPVDIGAALRYEYFSEVQVTSLIPSRGDRDGGMMVSILGNGFREKSVVCRFGTRVQDVLETKWESSSLIQCVSPKVEAPGIVEVEVSVNDGAEFTSNGIQYMYEIGAEVHSMLPSRSSMGTPGETVTVTGKYFESTAALSCWFGDFASTRAFFVSSTTVTCTVPERDLGTVYLTVGASGIHMGQREGKHFEYVPGGKILSLSPSAGPVSGSTAVTVKGVYLTAVSMEVRCRFGDLVFGASRVSDTAVVCMSPAHGVAEVVEVSLVWDSGSVQTSNVVQYVYRAHPSVVQLQPTRGPTAGTTLVTVVGTGFDEEGLLLRMGTSVVDRSEVMWASSTKVLLTAPASDRQGKLVVEASVNNGADFTSDGKMYLYEAGASVESLLPSRGMSGKSGQVVTLVGQHFVESQELSCRFGDSLAVSGLYMSSSMIACTVPLREAGSVMVSASNNGQDAGPGTAQYTYEAWQGAVLTVTPSAGPISGGTTVTVHVSRAQSDLGSVRCKFGSEIVGGTSVSGSKVACVTPWMAKGGVVAFTLLDNVDGAKIGMDAPFMFYAAPRVTNLNPTRGVLTGGTTVFVTGSGFLGDEGLQCRFGEMVVTAGCGARWVTSTLVACIAPGAAGDQTGPVTVDVRVRDGRDSGAAGPVVGIERYCRAGCDGCWTSL
jgi:hypothetical protein